MSNTKYIGLESLYSLRPKIWWQYFKNESLAFKMLCLYFFVEYVRPQSIFPSLKIVPWANLFVIGALIGLLIDRDRRWVRSPTNKWMILLFVAILWSSYNAYVPQTSYEYLAYFYTWLIVYFLIINIVTSPHRLLFFLAIFCLASFKISLSLAITWAQRGFAFTSWGLKGPPGFFENSGELAIQMAVFWPIGLAIALALKQYLPKWKYRVLMLMPVTACMVILGASSRGAQLAMAVQFCIRFFRKIFNLKALLVLTLVVSFGWYFLPMEQKQRFEEAGQDKTSLQRLYYWEGGLEMMNEHPLTGVGYFNFPDYFGDYYPHLLLVRKAELPHNIFIQVGADLGYPGLFIYLAMIISCFLILRRCNRAHLPDVFDRLPTGLAVSFIGYLIAGQFVSVVYYPFMWIHLAIVSSLSNISAKEAGHSGRNNNLLEQ